MPTAPSVIDTFDVSFTVTDELEFGDSGTAQPGRVLFVNDVVRFQIAGFTLNGNAWTITSATLKLVDPTGTVNEYLCTGSGGSWFYDTFNEELDTSGVWRKYWSLSDGTISLTFKDYGFIVRTVE